MEQVSDRLRRARLASGYKTVTDACRAFGFKRAAYTHHESGLRGLKTDVAQRYARAFGVSQAWLLTGEGKGPDGKKKQEASTAPQVMLIGDVQAGAWTEFDAVDQVNDIASPFTIDSRYNSAKQFAFRVRGTSMNKLFLDDDLVHCVDFADSGRDFVNDDIVVVIRSRGDLHETTLKQVKLGRNGKVELWPSSNDPRHQKPILMIENHETDNDEIEVRIGAFVVALYRALEKGR